MDNLLTVGYYKGEMDFGVKATIAELTQEQMKDFREMVVVAIGTAEEMWRQSQAIEQLKATKQTKSNN